MDDLRRRSGRLTMQLLKQDGEIYKKLERYAWYKLGKYVPDKEERQEYIHEAILRASQLYDPAKAMFTTYCQRWMKGLVLNGLRRNKKHSRNFILTDNLPEKHVIDKSYAAVEANDYFDWLCEVLNPEEKEILKLWAEKRKITSIAEIVDIPRTTVHLRLRTALRLVRARAEENKYYED